MKSIKFRQPIFREGSFVQWHYWGFLSKGLFVAPSDDSENWEKTQQFTGLPDKNGKEIYKGDLLKDYLGNIHEVVWGPRIYTKLIQKNAESWPARHLDCTYMDWEVIGNIYEHEHLLNK